jgi:hypothetical protein
MTPIRISDYQQKAKNKLSSMAYEYYVGGSTQAGMEQGGMEQGEKSLLNY